MEKQNEHNRLNTLSYTTTHVTKARVTTTVLWIFACALSCTVVSLPVPSSPFVPAGKEPQSLKTFAASSSYSSSSSSSSSVVASLLRPSLSSSRSSSSAVSSSSGWTDIATSESLGYAVSRKRRELERTEPQSQLAIPGLQKKAGTDSEVTAPAPDVADTPVRPRRLRHSKSRGSKKRPTSRKHRHSRKKCSKKSKSQRRRKQRKCLRSRKSGRNGKKKKKKRRRRRRKQNTPTPERRGRKRGRQSAAGDNSARPASEEAIRREKKENVKPNKVNHRHFQPTQVATFFENASPLEHIQRKQPRQRPVNIPLQKLASGYGSSQPLSTDSLKKVSQKRSKRTASEKDATQLSKPSKSRHHRFERSTSVVLKHLNSFPTGGKYSGFKRTTPVLHTSNHRTKGLETPSKLLGQKDGQENYNTIKTISTKT